MSGLAVAGLGLIGGSVARCARSRGDRVIGFDPDPETATYAREHRLVDETVAQLSGLFERAETLVVAAPLEATLEILEQCAGREPDGVRLIVDVASVKAPLLPFVARVRGFVPTHPLAGGEGSGPRASRADLFAGRPWAYVPAGDERLDALAVAFIASMCARPVALDAAHHDRVVALTSHVPQLLSTILAAELAGHDDASIAELYGPGLESMLRLARSGWPMWSSLVAANAGSIARGLRALAGSATAAADRIEAGDFSELQALFERANAFTERLDARSHDRR
ncbi:MAG TPA: prephenate dehydrogenase/arogenate dehydrogenase family protein [Candidatus Acidoferrales bacterium]|nr:prephenate dehydrogenase/arogenate dehydrogenase family protein [Candidatus Acidoferrales bacterium]